MIRVLVADDEKLLRDAIGYILNQEEDMRLVGLTGDGDEVIKKCKIEKPDVILMDIKMPTKNGIKAAKEIKKEFPKIKIIMLTTFENLDDIMEAFVYGVDGYILKEVTHEDIPLIIRCAYRNLTVIHESVKQAMTDRFKLMLDFKSDYKDILTDREIKIIKNIALGKTNKEIAQLLNYSEGTIKNNVSKILEKLNLDDRFKIAAFAIKNQIHLL